VRNAARKYLPLPPETLRCAKCSKEIPTFAAQFILGEYLCLACGERAYNALIAALKQDEKVEGNGK